MGDVRARDFGHASSVERIRPPCIGHGQSPEHAHLRPLRGAGPPGSRDAGGGGDDVGDGSRRGAGPDRLPAGALPGAHLSRTRVPHRDRRAGGAVPGRDTAAGRRRHPGVPQGHRPEDRAGRARGAGRAGARLPGETGARAGCDPAAAGRGAAAGAAARGLSSALRLVGRRQPDRGDGPYGGARSGTSGPCSPITHRISRWRTACPPSGCASSWPWSRNSTRAWAPFRLLTGIECDILDDGSLDQDPELLELLDVVVVSVHSSCAWTRVR